MTQINTNIPSLYIQRNLVNSQSAIAESLERISSGLRINSAKDDAAGLAISIRFNTQVRGINVAVRNANDALSFAQTTESALDEVTRSLQRIRDLAVQSTNGSNSSSDRLSLQEEVTQLVSEIERIAQTTTFNGNFVANGSVRNLDFQVGPNSGENVSVGGVDVRTSALGKQPGTQQSTASSLANSGVSLGAASIYNISGFSFAIGSGTTIDVTDSGNGGTIDIANVDALVDSTTVGYGSGLAKDLAVRINDLRSGGASELDGVYANAYNFFNYEDTEASLNGVSAFVAAGSLANGELTINGVDVGPVDFQALDADGALSNAINANSNTTGVKASVDAFGRLLLEASDGRDIIVDTSTTDVFNVLFDGGDATADTARVDNQYKSGRVIISAEDTISTLGYDNTYDINEGFNVRAVGTVQNSDVTTVSGANITINAIDSALEQVDLFRASIGAVQSRFDSTIRNLSAVSESLQAASSRITDADFAAETARLTRYQLLQQAGIAVLAQANASPQLALSLLSG